MIKQMTSEELKNLILHGNKEIIKEVLENYTGECTVVRASRVLEGAVFDSEFFDSKRVTIPAYKFSAQKARILLMLALNCTKNHETIKSFFQEY